MELPQVDLDQLRDLMKLMDQYDFDELDLRDAERRLHLLRNAGGRKGATPVVMPTVVASAPAAAPAPVAAGVATVSSDALPANIKVITSPMVGTFYRAPSPDSASFVEEGQQVSEDTILCIIEAMKVMNEIKAECAGELVKVLVANGEAVEYGEPLFHVRLNG